MHQQKITSIALLLLFTVNLPRTAAADSPDDILVIANKGIDTNQITVDELKQIFLGKKSSWKGGDRIVCLNQFDSHPIRNVFRKKVLNMSPKEEETYWEAQKVRRQLAPPPELTSIPKAVFKLKNAISYAYRKDVPDNVVKVLLVLHTGNDDSTLRSAPKSSFLFGATRWDRLAVY